MIVHCTRVLGGMLALAMLSLSGAPALAAGKAGALASGLGNAAGSTVSGLAGTASGMTSGASAISGMRPGAQAGISGSANATVGGVSTSAGASGQTTGSSASASGNANLSGPRGTITGADYSASSSGGSSSFSAGATGRSFSTNASIQESIDTAAAEQTVGTVKDVAADTVTLVREDGKTAVYKVSGKVKDALADLRGKLVALRTDAHGAITAVIGKEETLHGKVTTIAGDTVAFVTNTGDTHVVSLIKGGAAKLGLQKGSQIVAASKDYGRTVAMGLENAQPSARLNGIVVGTVSAAGGSRVSLTNSTGTQVYAANPHLIAKLQTLRGKVVALAVSDEKRVKSLLTRAAFEKMMAQAK